MRKTTRKRQVDDKKDADRNKEHQEQFDSLQKQFSELKQKILSDSSSTIDQSSLTDFEQSLFKFGTSLGLATAKLDIESNIKDLATLRYDFEISNAKIMKERYSFHDIGWIISGGFVFLGDEIAGGNRFLNGWLSMFLTDKRDYSSTNRFAFDWGDKIIKYNSNESDLIEFYKLMIKTVCQQKIEHSKQHKHELNPKYNISDTTDYNRYEFDSSNKAQFFFDTHLNKEYHSNISKEDYSKFNQFYMDIREEVISFGCWGAMNSKLDSRGSSDYSKFYELYSKYVNKMKNYQPKGINGDNYTYLHRLARDEKFVNEINFVVQEIKPNVNLKTPGNEFTPGKRPIDIAMERQNWKVYPDQALLFANVRKFIFCCFFVFCFFLVA